MLLISCYSCFGEFFVQFCIAHLVEFDISEIKTDVYRYFKHVQYIKYEAEVKHESVIDFCAGQDDFSLIPNPYPIHRKTSKNRLFPLAVRDVHERYIDKGHDKPKQIIIIASKKFTIVLFLSAIN